MRTSTVCVLDVAGVPPESRRIQWGPENFAHRHIVPYFIAWADRNFDSTSPRATPTRRNVPVMRRRVSPVQNWTLCLLAPATVLFGTAIVASRPAQFVTRDIASSPASMKAVMTSVALASIASSGLRHSRAMAQPESRCQHASGSKRASSIVS